MKTFKEHLKKEVVSEAVDNSMGVGVTTSKATDDAGNAHQLEHPEVMQKVNAFIGSVCEQEFMTPNSAVEQLKSKLMTLGLDFKAQLDGQKGSVTSEVTQFGGRTGKDVDGSDLNDDGISHRKEGGLKIQFDYETTAHGMSKVYAKLV
jgi:hypothetical protein